MREWLMKVFCHCGLNVLSPKFSPLKDEQSIFFRIFAFRNFHLSEEKN